MERARTSVLRTPPGGGRSIPASPREPSAATGRPRLLEGRDELFAYSCDECLVGHGFHQRLVAGLGGRGGAVAAEVIDVAIDCPWAVGLEERVDDRPDRRSIGQYARICHGFWSPSSSPVGAAAMPGHRGGAFRL